MIRRMFALMLLIVGVIATPNLVGAPTVGAASPVLTPLNPARLLDTRPGGETIDGQAQRTGVQAGKTTFELQVTGRGGVPADASAVMLNVTAVTPTGLGFITVYPCGIDRPLASSLNFVTTTIPNAVFAKIGADGKVCVYTETTTHILADVNAYVPNGASPTPLNPARLLDTRPGGETIDGQAQRTGIQNSKTTFELRVTGRGGVPADASAVILNVTAANPTGLGFITVYPCGVARPLASNLNFTDTNIPNAVLAKIGTDGKVCIYTETTTHILADVNAYVPKDGSPTSLNPARLLDTRPIGETIDGQAQRTGIQNSRTTFELQVTGRGGVPANATAVMLNVTAANPTGLGFITVYPCGIDRPLASNLNFTTTNIANAVLAKIGTDGKVCIYTETTTHILADVTGYVAPNTTPNTTTTTTKPPTTTSSTTSSTTTAPTKPACPFPGATIPLAECAALVALYNSTGGPNWTDHTDWNTATDPCGWYGVTCNKDKSHVDLVSLRKNGLSGPLPPEIGDLTKVSILNLADNQLTSLPAEIGKLTNLSQLFFDRNELTSIPPAIGKLTDLTTLTIPGNQLISIPPEIGDLTNLTFLYLSGNRLTSVPSEIGRLSNLKFLYLSFNQITAVPASIGDLVNLTWLDLTDNQLTVLPPEIGKLTKLDNLHFDTNKLAVLPGEIFNLTELETLSGGKNQLTALSPRIGNLTKLKYLNLYDNQLTVLPSEIGKLTKLTAMFLNQNRLTAIPTEIGNLTELDALALESNQLTALPPEIGKLTKLSGLSVYDNRLASLPSQIGNLTNLTIFYANGNQLSGDITAALNPLRVANKIKELTLYGNRCISTTNTDLKTWLTSKDANWNNGC